MSRAVAERGVVRVLAVADSDSYLKWGASLLDTLPPSWERRLVVVRSPIAPTREQVDAALTGTTWARRPSPVLTARALHGLVDTYRPDALLLACTGPVIDVIASTLLGMRPRPVVVSGLPGISVPASSRVWCYRWSVDLLVVHSRREVREYTELSRSLGVNGQVGLATLPFLTRDGGTRRTTLPGRDRVVFAPQAMVPACRSDRAGVLRALAALAERRTDLHVVVKVRAREAEMQTHRERFPYPEIWRDLVVAGEVRGDAVGFETGPLRTQLKRAVGLVTVGSTAVLEAARAGVPLLVLSDFGGQDALHNVVFVGSGCMGTLAGLERADFRHPHAIWATDNYLHDPECSDWLDKLGDLVDAARARTYVGPTSPPPGVRPPVNRTRSRLRLMVPPGPYRGAVRATRRLRRRVRFAVPCP